MGDGPDLATVLAETKTFSDAATLSNQEYESIKRAVFGATFRKIARADRAYFVLGRYDDGDRERRLEAVTSQLGRRDRAHAFLMRDVPEAWEFWPTKFHILAQRATYVVPVLEDTDGSHQWELGVVAGPEYRPKVYVLKRTYRSQAVERRRFDALPAQFVEILDRDGRVFYWQTEDELWASVEQLP